MASKKPAAKAEPIPEPPPPPPEPVAPPPPPTPAVRLNSESISSKHIIKACSFSFLEFQERLGEVWSPSKPSEQFLCVQCCRSVVYIDWLFAGDFNQVRMSYFCFPSFNHSHIHVTGHFSMFSAFLRVHP